MMTDSEISKAFENHPDIQNIYDLKKAAQNGWYCSVETRDAFIAFKAAITLLMPVIEKLQESNDTYAQSPENGYLARQTQQQVREMLGNLIKEEI